MTSRREIFRAVLERLDDRKLIWVGLRGDDIEPLADLPNLAGSFSLSSSYEARSAVESVAYEDITGVRVDPEVWDIDAELHTEATVQFRRALLRALSGHSAVIPYRPSQFLSAISFARRDRTRYLGLFGAHQSAFEHKPWVESGIADLGIPHIPWTYVADEEQLQAQHLAQTGPIILRRSRTSGGEGILKVDDARHVAGNWPTVDESFVSVAPYIDHALPVNIGATVWRDGISVHYPSVQIIGIPSCVTREFGYCGNDFGAARELEPVVVDQLESSTVAIGEWLRSRGYLGTYGVDFLVRDGVALFTEVNPRFQGSTQSSCRISIEADEPCLMLEHLAAWLGLERPPGRRLRSRMKDIPELSNLVVHWTGPDRALDAQPLVEAVRRSVRGLRADVLAQSGVEHRTGSTVARLAIGKRLTSTGYEIDDAVEAAITQWRTKQHPEAEDAVFVPSRQCESRNGDRGISST